MNSVDRWLEPLRALHREIRQAVVEACETQATEALAAVAAEDESDTIYAIDRVSEEVLVESIGSHAERLGPVVLVAEGLPGGRRVLPDGASPEEAVARILVDPIDGTRGLMYQKRSAWILTGVAPNRGDATRLSDIELAIQTEIPLVKQHLSDELWAFRGRGVSASRYDRLAGIERPLRLSPSRATTLAHGCAMLTRFFPGARDELAAIDDAIARRLLGDGVAGKAAYFEDQYASTGGQLYELASGHDRFNADLRPLMAPLLAQRGLAPALCCHPYDLATILIATELGVCITAPSGGPLDAPFDVTTDVAWVGYANEHLRAHVEPALVAELRERGWLR